MPDLDQAIAEWRRQLAFRGLDRAELLDELESHLRDDIESQLESGIALDHAFRAATSRFGEPILLRSEFHKLGGVERACETAKRAWLLFAAIPNTTIDPTMNSSSQTHLEPAWITYLKNGAFVGPALILWTATTVLVLPKLQQICKQANIAMDFSIWKVMHSNFSTMVLFREYGALLLLAIIAAFGLLEWRAARWPRYRRLTLGIGAFAINAIVLVSIFFMIIAAVAVAPALLPPTP